MNMSSTRYRVPLFWRANWSRVFFGGKLNIVTFVKVLCLIIVKCLNEKKALQRFIRFFNFGPNWDNIGGFSQMGQGIGRSPALAKNFAHSLPHHQEKFPN